MRRYKYALFIILGILLVLIGTSLVMPKDYYYSSNDPISSSFTYNDKREPNNSDTTLLGRYLVRPALYIWDTLTEFFASLIYLLQHGYRASDTKKLNEDVFNKVVEPDKVIHYFGNTSQQDIDRAASSFQK